MADSGTFAFHHETSAGNDSGSAYAQRFRAGSLDTPSPLTAMNQFNILKVAGSIAVVALAAYLGWRVLRSRRN